MSFRQTVTEKDLSSYVVGANTETGGFVIKSRKGPTYPVLITNYDEFITWFGEPNQDFWGGYEVLNFIGTAPAWVTRVVGSGYTHGGVDVKLTSVTPFGTDTGRTLDNYNLSNLSVQRTAEVRTIPQSGTYATGTLKTANGTSNIYAGNIYSSISGTFEPHTANHLKLNVYNNQGILIRKHSGLTVSSGPNPIRTITLSGVLDSNNSTLNISTGAISLDFLGNVGTPFSYTSGKGYDATSSVLPLVAGKTYGFYLNIDGIVIDNIAITDNDGTLTVQDLVDQLNTAIDNSSIGRDDLVDTTTVGGKEYITISGTIGSATYGNFRLKGATDTDVYLDPVPIVLEDATSYSAKKDGVTATVSATDPTSYTLKNGEYIEVEYIVEQDLTGEITHSFFTASPYDDNEFDYRVAIKHTPDNTLENGQRIYTMNLYLNTQDKGLTPIQQFIYSLDKIKSREGSSLYIMDVFRNNQYLVPVINTSLSTPSTVNYSVSDLSLITPIRLTGGTKGSAATDTDITRSWAYFKKAKRYPIKTFMNIYGDTASFNAIKDLVMNYQKYSFAISIVPFNYTVQDAIDYRQGLGLDTDKMALYHNWEQIRDVLGTNSFVWVSGIGKIGAAYAQMEDIYDAESPAGVNENGIGGQLGGLSPYSAIQVQYDYDDYDLRNLDDAQINPKVLDPLYGLILKGDRTLKVTKGDTSFIGARRLYNYILSNIIDQVLTLQEFRLNDAFHRARMSTFCTQIIQPILNAGYLREAQIICDESNNTDEVLNRREFVIDIYVKVTPNSQFIKLNFIRLSQTQSIGNVV